MKRRSFTALAAAVLLARPVRAQLRSKLPSIGILTHPDPIIAALCRLRRAPAPTRFHRGRNLALEFIHPNSESGFGEAARDLVRRKVDVILTGGSEIGLRAAMEATDTLPIVMVAIDYDPVAHGYVASLARPGGNVTGPLAQQVELAAKRVQIVEEAFPDLSVYERSSVKSAAQTQHRRALPQVTLSSGLELHVLASIT